MAAGNGTRYRVLLGANDTGGEYFSVEVLMRKEAYGAVRGEGEGPARGGGGAETGDASTPASACVLRQSNGTMQI